MLVYQCTNFKINRVIAKESIKRRRLGLSVKYNKILHSINYEHIFVLELDDKISLLLCIIIPIRYRYCYV